MEDKVCNVCGISKPLDLFSKTKQSKTGYKGHCKQCHNEINRKYYSIKDNSDKQRAWAKNNPESRKKSYRKHNLKRYYGISLDEYENMLALQNYVCIICKQSDNISLSVDHNHETGAIRGLLCNNCNNGLGRFKDSIELLLSAVEYLKIYDNPL